MSVQYFPLSDQQRSLGRALVDCHDLVRFRRLRAALRIANGEVARDDIHPGQATLWPVES